MKKHIGLILGMTAVIGVNIYFRTFPVFFPQFKDQAKTIVENKIYDQARADVDKRFSRYDTEAQAPLIEESVAEYKRNKRPLIKNQIQEEYRKLKDRYQDEHGQTYLMELDCWNWARYTENVIRLGHPGDEVRDGRQFDSLMRAPSGGYLMWSDFLFYCSAFLYKIFSFVKQVPVFTFCFYLPLFFSTIFIVLLYVFCYQRWGNIGAIPACLFIGLSTVVLQRSCAGWYDIDILTLIFPFAIVWAHLKAGDEVSLRQRIVWGIFSGLLVGLFALVWPNWWFIFLIVVIYELYSLLNILFEYFQYRRKDIVSFKQHALASSLFFIFSFMWVYIFIGQWPLTSIRHQVLGALVLNNPVNGYILPNVYATVGELQKGNSQSITSAVGGPLQLLVSLLCMLGLFLGVLHSKKSSRRERELIALLALWLIVMFFACFKGVRFALFIITPMGIALGWGASHVYSCFKHKSKAWASYSVVLGVVLLSSLIVSNAAAVAVKMRPFMNDVWYKVLNKIKDTTPKEAIINSWWDFGDWFKVVAKRRVIFDGQSQNLPQAYWMARVLLSQDEEEAWRILRMLNNGYPEVFDKAQAYFQDPLKTTLYLNKLLKGDYAEGKENPLVSLQSVESKGIEALISKKPSSAYFIVDYTMINNISPISKIGNWSFERASVAQDSNKKHSEEFYHSLQGFGIGAEELQHLYQESFLIPKERLETWTTRSNHFYSGFTTGEKDKNTLLFGTGIVYNPGEKMVRVFSCFDRRFMIPKSLILFENNTFEEIPYQESDFPYSVLVAKSNDTYQAILLDRELARSLFVRLYFLGGKGLKHFKPFIEEKDGEKYIRVFEIMWD